MMLIVCELNRSWGDKMVPTITMSARTTIPMMLSLPLPLRTRSLPLVRVEMMASGGEAQVPVFCSPLKFISSVERFNLYSVLGTHENEWVPDEDR